ncbi:DUF47 family protein [Winkia neuii]|nr:DUF47 family protein [Winkia neuii]WEB72333.1 DUF47 family protein [Winkia neuii]
MEFRPTCSTAFKRSKSSDDSFFALMAQTALRLKDATELLAQIIHANPEDRPPLRDKLHDVEHAADELTHQISRKLNQTFVTPLDRDDIQMLAYALDDCVDQVDEGGGLIVTYNVDAFPKQLSVQVDVLQRCAELTADAMPRLNGLSDLRDYWVEINRLENEGDVAYNKLLAKLFNSDLDPIDIIKLKDIIDSLEEGIDSFETLANTIETIAIKES